MEILIDSDVLLDIALARDPFVHSSRLCYSKLIQGGNKLFVSALALGNIIYLITKYRDKYVAGEFVKLVLKNAEVTQMPKTAFINAIEMGYPDLEDGIQIEAAKAVGINLIITRNLRDYKNKFIPVKTPEQYLKSIG